MTPYSKVYDAFLSKILEDEWSLWTREEVEADMRQILESAIVWFKFPRVSLEHDDDGFKSDLSSAEIQIIASYMKCEWLNRSIMTWENVKPQYEERDFSQGNLIDKLRATHESERKLAHWLESAYYRSREGKPYNYGSLAGN